VTSSDFAQTDPQREVHQLLSGQLRESRTRLDQLMAGDVQAFRQFLRSRNLPNAIM
jgi:hypothetical protein